MKVYLAAPYVSMIKTREEAYKSIAEGHEVTARWLNGDEAGKALPDAAQMDLDDVDRADILVVYTFQRGTPFTGGGRFVEMGYALTRKTVFVVGERENVFCHLNQVTVCGSTEGVLQLLRGRG